MHSANFFTENVGTALKTLFKWLYTNGVDRGVFQFSSVQ